MSPPRSTYTEGRFPHRRTSLLHADRIELNGSKFLSSHYQVTLPVSLLAGNVNRVTIRPPMFGAALLVFLAGLIMAPIGYFSRSEGRAFHPFEILWMTIPVIGIIMLWMSRKIEIAQFTGSDGLVHYDVSRTGPDREHFEEYVALVVQAARHHHQQQQQESDKKTPPVSQPS